MAALLGCPGCLRHRLTIAEGYRIQDQSGMPMLVPAGTPASPTAAIQTLRLTLPAPASAARELPATCETQGAIFSLRPVSTADDRSWTLTAPTAPGWENLSAGVDLGAQWRLFLQALGRMHDRGCFPSSLSTEAIRAAIARIIPLPANVVPALMYSDQGERFVDLAPDMEIGIQKVLSTSRPATVGPQTSVHLLTAEYEVVPRPGGKLGMKLLHHANPGSKEKLAAADRELLALDQRFPRTTALRLFLKGFSEEKHGKSESDALLVGTTDSTQLDAATEQLRRTAHFGCASLPGTTCMDFPAGSISLFSEITVNGRRTAFPFGSPLGLLLFSPPFSQPPGVLQSVQVYRELNPHRYGRIVFTRTDEGARQVLLLPGDRVEWKN